MKKLPLSRLKKKAWKTFSEWIRKRGVDLNGFNVCITCGVRIFWKDGHAGHYFHSHNSKSFISEENVNFQCRRCNHFLSGNLLSYHDYMLVQYGQEKIDELKSLRYQVWKPSRQELENLIKKYE